MAFTGKTEFGKVLAAKLRSQLVVDGLFRREYKGDALGVAVKTPMTTDDELSADYDGGNIANNTVTYLNNQWVTTTINHHPFVNKYIPGFNLTTASWNAKADAVSSAAYSVAKAMNSAAIKVLIQGAQGKNEAGTAFASGDPRYNLKGTINKKTTDFYADLAKMSGAMTDAGVPMEDRYCIVNGTGQALVLASPLAVKYGQDEQAINGGVIAELCGFKIKVSNLVTGQATATGQSSASDIVAVCGHPDFGINPSDYEEEPTLVSGNYSQNTVGGVFVKALAHFAYDISDPRAFGLIVA